MVEQGMRAVLPEWEDGTDVRVKVKDALMANLNESGLPG